MDVGESGLRPETAVKKKMCLPLKIVLCILVIIIIGLITAVTVILIHRSQPVAKCGYKSVAEVNEAIMDSLKLSESKELEKLDELAKECEKSEYKYDFKLAKILELDKYEYYEMALDELSRINSEYLTLRLKYNYYSAYSVVYKSLGDEEKVSEYDALTVKIYKELYGEGGGGGGTFEE